MMLRLPFAPSLAAVWVALPCSAAALPAQSALSPAGPQAAGAALLWWVMLTVAIVIFVAVMAVLGVGLWQARKGDRRLTGRTSRYLVIGAGVAIPLLVLIVLVAGSLLTGRNLATPPAGGITVEVVGWRWWWEIRYLDAQGELIATTANELHVPVDTPVRLRLRTADVIHSFWVPNLSGKTDLVPGVINTSWFQAERAGIYRGQCAEFCGSQHALMGFLVVAEPPDRFEQWLALQRQPARPPQSEVARLGRQVYRARCASCHIVRETDRDAWVAIPPLRQVAPAAADAVAGSGPIAAPDLTHFGSRRTIAAAVRPNTRGHLGGWISDPQRIKPGTLMPRTLLSPSELQALVVYLEGLR